jgi:hypothetical protein
VINRILLHSTEKDSSGRDTLVIVQARTMPSPDFISWSELPYLSVALCALRIRRLRKLTQI